MTSEDLKKDVQKFLEEGGEVTVCPPCTFSYDAMTGDPRIVIPKRDTSKTLPPDEGFRKGVTGFH